MKKSSVVYICSECGYQAARWLGCCPDCGSWNTFQESAPEVAKTARGIATGASLPGASPKLLSEIVYKQEERVLTGCGELDRVLGGGLVPGSVILMGGAPGIGKSTLLIQVANSLSEKAPVLYISGEESAQQIKGRADRLGIVGGNVKVLCETDVEHILTVCKAEQPATIIVDSVQTMAAADCVSVPGSVAQVRTCAAAFTRYAKEYGVSVFLVGHVTKEGALAGPRILEHMVDAVLYFEGDRQHEYRLLRSAKNRFGSVNELGVFEMTATGMMGVENPSQVLLSQRARGAPGSVVLCTLQGTRPILCDLQALVAKSFYAVPRRTVGGMDDRRVALLLAVMEKRAGQKLFDQDVYISVAGGISLSDPAADLAVCVAVAGSLRDFTLPSGLSVMGEVGLCGEVRPVARVQQRVDECARLGMTEIILPKQNMKGLKIPEGIKVTGVDTLMQTLAVIT